LDYEYIFVLKFICALEMTSLQEEFAAHLENCPSYF